MVDEFATVGGGKPFFHFVDEPFIVVDQALHGFHYQRFVVAAQLSGKAGELACRSGFRRTSMVLAWGLHRMGSITH
jgi:hypothetical protein